MAFMSLVAPAVVAAIAVGYRATNSGRSDKVTVVPDREVVYQVTGSTTSASITYSTPGGGTGQQADIDVPLVRKSDGGSGLVFSMRPGEFAYLSAQNSNARGNVTCVITVDGVELARNTSTGAYTIATCEATVF